MINPFEILPHENLIELLYTPIQQKLRGAERMKAYMHKGRSVHISKEEIDGSINLETGMVDPFADIAEMLGLNDVKFEVGHISKDAVELLILEPTKIYLEG